MRCIDEASICWIFILIILTIFYIVLGGTRHVVDVFEDMLRTGITSTIQKVMGIAACVRMDSENVPKLQFEASITGHMICKKELHLSVKMSLTWSQRIP